MCCASSSKQALIASFSYQVIRHPGREFSASMSHSSMPGTSFSLNPPASVRLAMGIHFKQVPDEFARHACVRPDFPQ